MNQPILDATCGGRMMWFDKHNPACLYVDKRMEEHHAVFGTIPSERHIIVNPDVVADFTSLPFPDKSFKLVVFDPPHVKGLSDKSWTYKHYGTLADGWQQMIHDGFRECLRVLDDYGTLIFKWSAVQIPTADVIRAIGCKPLFGHISGKKSNTHWMAFMKGVSDA